MQNNQVIRSIFFAFVLLLGLCQASWAVVDNRLCPVQNSNDDNSLFSLRRNIEHGFNRTQNRACTEIIKFDVGQTFNITLHDTLKVTNSNDTDTDVIAGYPFPDDNYNLLVDGQGANVTIDATEITGQNKCAIELSNSNSKWQGMTIRVRDASKAFCDNGNNNHHVNGEDGLVILVVDAQGNTPPPPQDQCNSSDPCCSNGHWRSAGEACEQEGVEEGHCNAEHQCVGTALPPADADNDTVVDSEDNCPQISNTNQADGDNDHVGDVCDNCPQTANPDQADADHDGTGDACEAATPNTNSDSDSHPDATDNCDDVANEDQADADHDGIGDACDNDIDGDGLANADDPNDNNPNIDGDDLIDGVDDCPEEAGPATNHGCPSSSPNPNTDSDSDGVANDADQCPNQAGPAANHGCPSTNTDDPNSDDNNQTNTNNCSGNSYAMTVTRNGETLQKSVCGSGGGCSFGGMLLENKGHYFMALISLGLFIMLGFRRFNLQKDSNK